MGATDDPHDRVWRHQERHGMGSSCFVEAGQACSRTQNAALGESHVTFGFTTFGLARTGHQSASFLRPATVGSTAIG